MQPTDDHRPDPIDALVDRASRLGPGDEPLGSFLAALREDAAVTVASPAPSLVRVLTDGLPAPGAVPPAAPTGSTWRRRMALAGRVLVTKFAALGLLAKAATAGAAVTIAASGAGVAGVLPAPAQEAFDVVVGRDAPAGPGEESPAAATDDGTTIESPGGGAGPTTAGEPVSVVDDDGTGVDEDRPGGDEPGADENRPGEDEPGAFGERVSGDATGETDGVPGVDGREVSSEASDGRSEQRGASGEARDRRGGDAGATDPTADASDADADTEPEDGAPVGDDTDRGDTGDGDATDGDAADGDAADAPVAGGGAGNGGADDRGRGVGPPPGAPANGRGG